MSSEMKVTLILEYDNDGITESISFLNKYIDVTGDAKLHNIQTVGTSEEALLLGDVTTGGVLVVHNTDSANFVELRSGTGATNNIKIKAGEAWAFRTSDDAAAPFAIADTAAVKLEYWLFSD